MKTVGKPNQIIADIATKCDPGTVYECDIDIPKKKRSLDANAYYWALIHRYAKWTHKSDTYWHNDIMERFGEDDEVDGYKVYVVLPDEARYKELVYIHLRQTTDTRVGKDGKLWRTFIKRKDSHTLDSAQFSRLIDGLIEEIQGSDAPIETMTPRELANLRGYVR